jgi:hypothetical protein
MNDTEQSIKTTPNPRVVIEVEGNLWLKGWNKSEVFASCPECEDLTLEQRNDEVMLYCRKDCTVRVPLAASVQVKHVHGQATIKSLEGDLHIDEVDGNLTLRNVGMTTIESVQGNLLAQDVSGDLKIHSVDGNANVKDVQGDLLVEGVISGNAMLSELDGNASTKVEGNLNLWIDPQPGNNYLIEAEGNLTCYLPADASVTIEVRQANRIQSNLPEAAAIATGTQAPHIIRLGDGDSTLTLSAEGNVLLRAEAADWQTKGLGKEVDWGADFESMADTITEQVMQQIEAQMEVLEQQLETHLENLAQIGQRSGLSTEQLERITEKARAASERAAARARAKMQYAEEKLRRKLERARQQAEHAARDRRRRVVQPGWASEPSTLEPDKEPITDEERLMILKMVEENKITVVEAEKLLKALEGENT